MAKKKMCKECGDEIGEDGICVGCGWSENEKGEEEEAKSETTEEEGDEWGDDDSDDEEEEEEE